ncbi:MAG: hypothetical protein R6U17_06740 [Thermoplasmata archaeon]
MFTFAKEQTTLELGDLRVGGQPGENATLAVGSIFYEGQFQEPKKALGDAEGLINTQRDMADELAVQTLVDIFIYDQEEIEWKVNFILEAFDGMISFDVPESTVRMQLLEYLEQVGSLDRTIYNSINLGITEEELKVIQRCTPLGAILLAYDPQDNSTQGRLNMIKGGSKLIPQGMLEMSDMIEYKLLDTAVTPFGEGTSESLRAIPVFKSEFGLPTGCAMHNAVEAWNWLSKYRRKEEVMPILDAAVDVPPMIFGADFIYYGPIENARHQLPMVAMIDRLIGEGAETYFGIEVPEDHPFNKL